MKKINFTTETYQLIEGEGYCVDIVKDIDKYSVYLYHIDYGIKMFVFGSHRCWKSDDEFLEMAYCEAKYQIPYYKNRFQY